MAREYASAARALGLPDPAAARALLGRGRGATGRAATGVVELPGRSERLHLRGIHHGGWLGGLLGRALLGVRRPVRELRVTALLEAKGAPVPHAALVVGWRALGPVWFGVVGTRHEEMSVDGVDFLQARPDPTRLLRAAAAAGGAVRRFHDAGGWHADLHIKNLLLREDAVDARVLVIDLDRARAGTAPCARRRMAEIMRLHRSLVKRGLLEHVGARGCARFLRAYAAGDRSLRRELLAHLPRERARLRAHAMLYRGRGPCP